MHFTKMHGAGNDFILINNMEAHIPEGDMGALAARLCARRVSVGADGVMFVDAPRSGGDYRMCFYNADGSMGEMCGNGARCIARYGYEKGLAGETQHIETTAGPVIGQRVTERMYKIRLNDPSVAESVRDVELKGVHYDCGYVELGMPGLPHAVVLMEQFDTLPEEELRELGRGLRYYSGFPKGANVTFVKPMGNNTFKARTFERGVEDFTLACGTGCGAVAAVMTLRGMTDGENVHISMPGGELYVSLCRQGKNVTNIYLTGPTVTVCEGEISGELLGLE